LAAGGQHFRSARNPAATSGALAAAGETLGPKGKARLPEALPQHPLAAGCEALLQPVAPGEKVENPGALEENASRA
jgi:hypothetical protein